MISLRLLLLSVVALAPLPGSSLLASDLRWPDALAESLAHLGTPDSVSLPNALRPAVSFASGPCRTSNMPSGDSDAPVTTALLVYVDEKSCDAPTPLVMLQLYIEAKSADDIERLKSRLAEMLPAPCFSGRRPPDPRRHAPAHELVVWKQDDRLLSVGQDVGRGSAAGIAFVRINAVPNSAEGVGRGDKALIAQLVSSLPAACR